MKDKRETEIEMKEKDDKGVSDAGVFASCSFADLGLHSTLCQHLQGFNSSSTFFPTIFSQSRLSLYD